MQDFLFQTQLYVHKKYNLFCCVRTTESHSYSLRFKIIRGDRTAKKNLPKSLSLNYLSFLKEKKIC